MKEFWRRHWIGVINIIIGLTAIWLTVWLNLDIKSTVTVVDAIREHWRLPLSLLVFVSVYGLLTYYLLRWQTRRNYAMDVDIAGKKYAEEVLLKDRTENKRISGIIWDRFHGEFPYCNHEYPEPGAIFSLATSKSDFSYRKIRLEYSECAECRVPLHFTSGPDTNDDGMHCPNCRKTITTKKPSGFAREAETVLIGKIKKMIREMEDVKTNSTT